MTNKLLDGLAFLADDALIAVAHALALVRFRRVEATNLGSDLANDLAIWPFDGQLGVFLDRHLDLVGNGIINWVRVAKVQINGFALNGGFKTDALDFELLDETFAHSADHVI